MKRSVAAAIASGVLILSGGGLLAEPPDEEIEMEVPLTRRVTNIAEHNGVVTLAGERAAGLYHKAMHGPPDEALHRACLELSFEERMRCPACFPFQMYELERDILEAGELDQRIVRRAESMYDEGYSRAEWRKEFDKDLEEIYGGRALETLRAQLDRYAGLRLQERILWDGFVTIQSLGVKYGGRSGPYGQNMTLVKDSDDGRYYIDYNTSTPYYPPIPMGIQRDDAVVYVRDAFPVIDSPPAGARIIRYRIDPESPPERRRHFVEELTDPNEIEFDDMILYVNGDSFPTDAPPFVDIDPAGLGEAGRQLQDALATQLRWYIDSTNPGQYIDDLVSDFHITQRQRYEEFYNSFIDEWERTDLERRAGLAKPVYGLNKRRPDQIISQLRVASRVFTDNGAVWFTWAPKPDAKNPDDVLYKVYYQLRNPDGSYGLLVSINTDALSGKESYRDRTAMKLLGNRIVGPITRPQREAQLGGE